MLTIYIHAFFALIAVPVGLYIFLTMVRKIYRPTGTAIKAKKACMYIVSIAFIN